VLDGKKLLGDSMATFIPVAIVGAGPYGLSIAAHLEASGVHYRIFGTPMRSWLEHMPERMFLKSTGFASSLSDPGRRHRLGAFRRQEGRQVEQDDVSFDRPGDDFQLRLASGGWVAARRVVLAVGQLYLAMFRSAWRPHGGTGLARHGPTVTSPASGDAT
jgi:thioredoxin reductase